uniref:Uncharacterized protein n=1 Tax=Glossina pallidipes TaxID=7398 RepID=A0A1A9ZJX2_GLOPL
MEGQFVVPVGFFQMMKGFIKAIANRSILVRGFRVAYMRPQFEQHMSTADAATRCGLKPFGHQIFLMLATARKVANNSHGDVTQYFSIKVRKDCCTLYNPLAVEVVDETKHVNEVQE